VFVPVSLWKCLSDVRSGSFLELSFSELECADILPPKFAPDLQQEKTPHGQERALETGYI
jgi:hypothetical protein